VTERYGPGHPVPDDEAPVLPLDTINASSLAGLAVPQRSFLDDAGLFPSRNVTMLSGDGGTGKSLLALQLGVAVATGTHWMGITVSAGPVLYLSAEDDRDELHRRLNDICAAGDLDLSAMRGLELAVLAGKDAVLAVEASKSSSRIAMTPLFQRLRQRLERTRPTLLVLDNLADIFAGNENVRSMARQFVGALRGLASEFNCVVLLLSHPSLSGINSGTGTSGNTAWSNSVRSRLFLVREKDSTGSEMDPDERVLQTMKSNYGPTGGQLRLRWKSGHFICPDQHGYGTASSGTVFIDRSTRVFLNLLRWHTTKGKPVSPLKSPTYAPALFARHPRNEGINSRIFETAMNLLLETDRIRIVVEGPPSRQRRRLEIVDSSDNVREFPQTNSS
jgi:KaiC/GvpD/RAD55 family RecA-like ATPase